MKKISVIMGIYNTKNKSYLEKSLNSILNQTYKNFELIICDDGSSNGCLNWAKEICFGDSRVIFLQNPKNMGLAYTLNHCLEFSTGDYIARMDDDDESALDRFEVQVDFLNKNTDIDLVSCNINLFDDNGIYNTIYFPSIIQKKDFLFNSPIVHPAIMARKKCFSDCCNYNTNSYAIRVEDYDLFMRMFSKEFKMAIIQKVLFNYRDDRATKKRRKIFKYRINEAIVRFKGFKKLKLFPIGFIFVLKPIIVGLLPLSILSFLKRGR